MTEFTLATGLAIEIVQQMVREHHENLKLAKIGVIFRDTAQKSGGNEVWASAAKADAKTNALLEGAGMDTIDFLLTIAENVWDKLEMDQRRALIDHELCHCAGFEGKWQMRGHDFEEFTVIVERWGFWRPSLFRATPALKKALQLDLGLDMEIKTSDGRVVAVPAALLAENVTLFAPAGRSDSEKYAIQACDALKDAETVSISILQRTLRIGYSRAIELMGGLERIGAIGPVDPETGLHEVFAHAPELVERLIAALPGHERKDK